MSRTTHNMRLTLKVNNGIFYLNKILKIKYRNSYKLLNMARVFLPGDRKSRQATSGSAP